MPLFIYTDASHCPDRNIATCGFHVRGVVSVARTIYTLADVGKPHEAEGWAVYLALNSLIGKAAGQFLMLYTDCMHVVDYYRSDKCDAYRNIQSAVRLLEQKDRCVVSVAHIKGHTKNTAGHHKYNNEVDKWCRKRLRQERLNHKR